MGELAPVLHSSRRVPELDGLRGVAVFLVVVFHYAVYDLRMAITAPVYFTLWVFQLGWSGVDLFFVLSGFLIGGILIDHRDSPRYFRPFYVRRFCRILPLYYVTVALFALGALLLDRGVRVPLTVPFLDHGPVWTYATFTQNYWMALTGKWGAGFNSVTWSLAIEEHFYLTLPLIVYVTPRAYISHAAVLVIVMSNALRWLSAETGPEGALSAYLMTHCRLDGLCLGVLAAWLLRRPGYWRWASTRRWALHGITLAGALGFWWLNRHDPQMATASMARYGYLMLSLFYASLIVSTVTFTDSWLASATRFAPLRALGKVSFCVYLIHIPVNLIAHAYLRRAPPAIATAADALVPAAAFATTMIIAYISWRVLESPLIRYGHRTSYGS